MTVRIERPFHVQRVGKSLALRAGDAPETPEVLTGRVPRVARLMALAIRFEELVQSGDVADYATLAKLGHVTRARISQIMNLLTLAPDIQEAILFLPPTIKGRDAIHLLQLQPIALTLSWPRQRKMWQALRDRL